MTKFNDILWNYGKGGALLSGMFAAIGTCLTYLVGGWDKMMIFLVLCMGVDVITGIISEGKKGKVDSKIMLSGGGKKVIVFCLVVVSAQADICLGNATPLLRTATIWFYIGRELLSLLENCGKMGIELPPGLMNALAQITNKGDKQ